MRMADGLLVERLRRYLNELHPNARALLMAELERGVLRGDDMPGAELVLRELRRDARDNARPKRPGNLARLFFQPLEPFLVDDIATHRHPGRIARVTLDPIWEWIGRDLMPGEARAVTAQVAAAIERGDTARAEELAFAFQDRVVIRIEETLAAAASDERARRLCAQIGTERGIDDAAAIATVLKARQAFKSFGMRLPGHIKSFDEATIGNVKALIDAPQSGGRTLFLYDLVIVMSRLSAPWQLIRLAIQAAGSNSARHIAETPYGAAVDIVFAEIERMIGELKGELRTGRGLATGALLKAIHDALRGVRTEIDLEQDSSWSRRLAALRTEISDLLKAEIEAMDGRLRRLIRPRPTREIAPRSALDQGDVGDTERLIEFVGACRAYAGELALGDLAARAWMELGQYLDRTRAALVECLRHAGPLDRPFRQSQLDAAIRFSARVFGEDDARVPARNDAAGGERKVAAKA